MMDRTVVRKKSLHEAEDAACPGLTPAERLSVLAELNRIGLAALGLVDRPLERSALRKFSFSEFAALASTPAVP